jgi:hypothetical protein
MLMTAPGARCERCNSPGTESTLFGLRRAGDTSVRCFFCALVYGPLLRRSLGIAVIVGSLLLAINQGDVLLGGAWPRALLWKIPLTYLVPFVVATWAALLNSRLR